MRKIARGWGGGEWGGCLQIYRHYRPINHCGLCENELYCVVCLLGSNQIPGVSLPPALLQLNGMLTATINNTIV